MPDKLDLATLLPDPGPDRYWMLTASQQLYLVRRVSNSNPWTPSLYGDDMEINWDHVDVTKPATIRMKAERLLLAADTAGTYYYEEGEFKSEH